MRCIGTLRQAEIGVPKVIKLSVDSVDEVRRAGDFWNRAVSTEISSNVFKRRNIGTSSGHLAVNHGDPDAHPDPIPNTSTNTSSNWCALPEGCTGCLGSRHEGQLRTVT